MAKSKNTKDDGEGNEPTTSELSSMQENTTSSVKKKKNKKVGKEVVPGVVYINHPPKFMKPQKVRHLLEQYGKITNLFLQPEDSSAQRRRVKNGGNRKTVYTEGWIEFSDKKVAKSVALSLNNTKIGGNKRSFFLDDVWNLKYLSGYKWSMLTEKMVYERKMREQRLRLEISKTKKENEFFMETVDKAKTFEKMEERKKESGTFVKRKAPARKFRQTETVNGKDKRKELKMSFLEGVLGPTSKKAKTV